MRSPLSGREVLEAQLHVLEPGLGEGLDLARAAQRAGGDEVAVKTVLRRGGDQAQKIAPRHRLAAGEMHLQHAERRRLGEHAAPVRSLKLARGALEVQRVGAIGALQRTAMRQLGEQRERRVNRLAPAETSLVGEVLQHGGDVLGDQLARRLGVARGQRIDDGGDARDAVASFRISTAFSSGSSSRSGARWSSVPAPCRSGRRVRREGRARFVDDQAVLSRPSRDEGAGRDQARLNIGEMERVELRPQHVALEPQRGEHRLC